MVDKEKEDFLTSSEKPQKRLKVSEQNLDADDPLGKFKAFIEIFYEKCYNTRMQIYHCHKPVFRPKMAIFWRAGMREGGKPLPLAFQYLILMI